MKWIACIFCLCFSAITYSQDDTTPIIQLLKNDYGTMANLDLNKHMGNCTADYLLIEAGDVWNMEKESAWYRDASNKGTERKNHFDFKYIRVDGNNAYAVYNLKSDIIKEGKLIQKNWSESAIFRKVNGVWKIALIHSTPVKQ